MRRHYCEREICSAWARLAGLPGPSSLPLSSSILHPSDDDSYLPVVSDHEACLVLTPSLPQPFSSLTLSFFVDLAPKVEL